MICYLTRWWQVWVLCCYPWRSGDYWWWHW